MADSNKRRRGSAGSDDDDVDIEARCTRLAHAVVDGEARPPFRARLDGFVLAEAVGKLQDDALQLRSDMYRGAQLTEFFASPLLASFSPTLQAHARSWERFEVQPRNWMLNIVNAPGYMHSSVARIYGPDFTELVLYACNDWSLRFELHLDHRKKHVFCLAALAAQTEAGNAERASELALQPFDRADRVLGFSGSVARNEWVRLVRTFFEHYLPPYMLYLGSQIDQPALYWADRATTRIPAKVAAPPAPPAATVAAATTATTTTTTTTATAAAKPKAEPAKAAAKRPREDDDVAPPPAKVAAAAAAAAAAATPVSK